MSYFGTDGIRGKFGVLPITPEFALKLGFAAGKVLKRHSKKSKPLVVLGKDTRLSGYILESALQAGLNAAGVYVHLLGPLPTPAIAHLTRALHASLGIVISASHNPYFDNGIKFFSSEGKKLPDAIQEEINQELEKELKEEEGQSTKAAPVVEAPRTETVDKKLTQKNKQRIEAIYVEIETVEGKLAIIEEKLATIDYSKEAQLVQAQMKILTEAQEQLTTKISSLYQELESLES